MSLAAPEPRVQQDDFDDSDPIYTHFQHRAEFSSLQAEFLSLDVAQNPSAAEDKDEVSLVTQLGAIVSRLIDYH